MLSRVRMTILLFALSPIAANAVPMIDVEKFTNGLNADIAGDGPQIAEGDVVAWTYQVTNTGDSALDTILLFDDNGTLGFLGDDFNPTFTGVDVGGDGILSPNEIWGYEHFSFAVAGQYTNIATVTGVISGSDTTVMDSDPSNYFGLGGVVPEPSTLALMTLGLAGIGYSRRKKM